jgi:hypothetical protein
MSHSITGSAWDKTTWYLQVRPLLNGPRYVSWQWFAQLFEEPVEAMHLLLREFPEYHLCGRISHVEDVITFESRESLRLFALWLFMLLNKGDVDEWCSNTGADPAARWRLLFDSDFYIEGEEPDELDELIKELTLI